MGSPIIEKRGLMAALNNCAFVSTKDLEKDATRPFEFLMDASMLGVGVGFDTKGADKLHVLALDPTDVPLTVVIEDSREGWVNSLRQCLEQYLVTGVPVKFDYSNLRAKGDILQTFGGVSSGPEPLMDLHLSLNGLLQDAAGQRLSSTGIVDIMNLVGKCVIAGGVRRTSEIAFGEADDAEFLTLKDYQQNPHRADFGWTSNNSVLAYRGMDYSKIAERIRLNGEPGVAWLHNMQKYSRMEDSGDWKDHRVMGGNPCLEQSLESWEMCCLVETFPAKHDNLSDFMQTLKYAYLYAKTVTLGKTHWPETNDVQLRNRRIGCSVSGVAQFLAQNNIETLRVWLEEGYQQLKRYDVVYSEWFGIPRSVKMTSVKPSGTVSLLAGATPGIHYPESRYYIRRVRLQETSHLLAWIKSAGYKVEPDSYAPGSVCVEFPQDAGSNVRTQSDVSMWEQLSLAAFLQRYWSDNQVSATVSFDAVTEGPYIARALDYFQYQLKGVSFLPKDTSAYAQKPYEAITLEEYEAEMRAISERAVDISTLEAPAPPPDDLESVVPQFERFCDSDRCVL